jgi:capsular polysaccharide export protein
MTTDETSDRGGDGPAAASAKAILRAPPFPGARPRGWPRSRLADGAGSVGDRETMPVSLLAEAMARTRTGGSFWMDQPRDRPFATLIHARSAREARSLTDRWRTVDGGMAVSVPRARWSTALRKTAGHGFQVIPDDSDLWPWIGRARLIVASARSELALLAAAAGKTITDPVTARPIPHTGLLDALGDRIGAFDYFDPFDGTPIDAGRWIEILGEWRRMIDANRQIGAAYGISLWKRPAIARFLWSGAARGIGQRAPAKAIAIWPSRTPADVTARAESADVPVIRIEDGFIRSAGLGTLLHPPQSIVVDRLGIYYDPHRASDLEVLLAEIDLDDRLRARAAKLIRALTDHGITKYGTGGSARETLPRARRHILVTGQVEDDQSVLLGGGDVGGNLDLLHRARAEEPDACIIYKPHPDVVAGLRKGHVDRSEALRHADLVLTDGAMTALFGQVDAVHVLTSLAGFEALLRGKEVVTHGQPFYAGWGLTRDLAAPIARRQRRLSLEELVAGALILYPRYLDPETRLPCPPEILVRRMAGRQRPRAGILQALRTLQGRLAIARRTLAGAAS